jgi:hypothetical protein
LFSFCYYSFWYFYDHTGRPADANLRFDASRLIGTGQCAMFISGEYLPPNLPRKVFLDSKSRLIRLVPSRFPLGKVFETGTQIGQSLS